MWRLVVLKMVTAVWILGFSASLLHLRPMDLPATASPAGVKGYAEARILFSSGDLAGTSKALEKLIVPKPKVAGKDLEEALKLWGVCRFLQGDYEGSEKIFLTVLKRNTEAKLQPSDILDPAIATLFEATRLQAREAIGASRPAPTRPRTPIARDQTAQVIFVTNVPRAMIFSNDVYVGGQGEALSIAPGKHEFLISGTGFQDERINLTIKSGQIIKKNVLLKPVAGHSQRPTEASAPPIVATPPPSDRLVGQKESTRIIEERYDPLPPETTNRSAGGAGDSVGGRSTFLAILPLGVGQFQNQHFLKGGLVLAAQLGGLAWALNYTLLLRDFDAEEKEAIATSSPFIAEESAIYRKDMRFNQMLGVGAFGLAWAVGVVDALVFLDDSGRGSQAEHKAREGYNLQISPWEGGARLSLVYRH